MKKLLCILSLLMMITRINVFAELSSNEINAGADSLMTEELFFERLKAAECATVMFTRPEAGISSDVSRFAGNFLSLYTPYLEGKGRRMIGGFARPEAFMAFLRQYFTDDCINELQNTNVVFDWDEDQVYWNCQYPPEYGYDVGEPYYSFKEFSENRIICHMVLYINELTKEPFEYDYIFEKTTIGWRFSSFATRVSFFEMLWESNGASEMLNISVDADEVVKEDDYAEPVAILSISTASMLFFLLALYTEAIRSYSKKSRSTRAISLIIAMSILIVFCGACNSSDIQYTEEPLNTSTTGSDSTASILPSAIKTLEPFPTSTDQDELKSGVRFGERTYSEFYDESGNKKVRVNKYHGTDTVVVIPGEFDGIKTGAVDSEVFKKDRLINSIKEVTFNGINIAPKGIFQSFTALEKVTFSDGLIKVEENAFFGCRSLKTVVGAEKIDYIGERSFCNCSSLESIVYSDKLTELGAEAFRGCLSAAGEVVIPASVKHIGAQPFLEANNITRLVFNSNDCSIDSNGSMNREYGSVCYGMGGLSELIIGEGVSVILPYMFACGGRNDSLTVVSIPEGITKIGDGAFYNCGISCNIELPSGITEIGSKCFAMCFHMPGIIFPDSIESIGASAFADDYSLAEVQLPGSLTSISDGAFLNCCSLRAISIPDGVSSIGASAFRCCDRLTEVILPESLNVLPESCFAGCANLHRIDLRNVDQIGDNAFYLCTSLEEVKTSNGIEIDSNAFGFCFKLFPDTVFDIPSK